MQMRGPKLVAETYGVGPATAFQALGYRPYADVTEESISTGAGETGDRRRDRDRKAAHG